MFGTVGQACGKLAPQLLPNQSTTQDEDLFGQQLIINNKINPFFFNPHMIKNKVGFKCDLIQCFNLKDWIGFGLTQHLHFLQCIICTACAECACLCACVCALCVHVCVNVCECACACECAHVCVHVGVCMCVCIVCACVRACRCVDVCVGVCMCMCVWVCMYMCV